MRVLIDTNVFARAAQRGHPMNVVAAGAIDALRLRGDELCVVPQTFY